MDNMTGQEQGAAGSTGGENGNNSAFGSSTKTFTQDDVNRIVQERLAKEKQKGQEGIDEKVKELEAKELRLDSVALLRENGLPDELSDIISASNIKEFGEKVEKLKNIMNNLNPDGKAHAIGTFSFPGTIKSNRASSDDELKRAFGL